MTQTSIVVIGWNETEVLENHLSSLRTLRNTSGTELIAVVGGSDGTYERYQIWSKNQSVFESAKVLQQHPDDGISGAIRRGFNEASGDYILYLEADTEIKKEWLTEMKNSLQEYDAVSAYFEPKTGWSLRWANEWIQDRSSLATEQTRLSGAQTIGLNRRVVEDLLLGVPLPDTLVDWNLHKRVAKSDYEVGRADTVVSTRIASSKSSYDDFCQMQANAVAEISDRRNVVIQLTLHLGLLALPPAIIFREFNTVREAAQIDNTTWKVAPLFFLARYVLVAARTQMCVDRLLHGARY